MLIEVRLALLSRLPDVDDAKDAILVVEPGEMDRAY